MRDPPALKRYIQRAKYFHKVCSVVCALFLAYSVILYTWLMLAIKYCTLPRMKQ